MSDIKDTLTLSHTEKREREESEEEREREREAGRERGGKCNETLLHLVYV